ncbi:MAG: VWA domain-containing protein [Ruminococcus flavefaciens]|nr:VWA domain-containing protein [Ruminococcus flavefaciens]MCM1231068.1 VWA domain-containing protein [Ruminococcus flavefaciens]
MDLKRGMRDKLDNHINTNGTINIGMSINGSDVYDFCCFGVDSNDKLSDERYMIFYNQTSSPNNEIQYSNSGNSANFSVNLARLPMNINKLVFTVSIDGNTTMGNINSHTFSLSQNGATALRLQLSGADFKQEKAIITVEIYRKDGWRINAIARGFNGGLGDLLRSYGGEEAVPETAPSVQSAPEKVSLEKKLAKAPQLVSLAKPLTVELKKRNLMDVIARVALVMDISGSMSARYSNGTVQEIVNKILPLAVQFDDDGELDFWYYGSKPMRMNSVNLNNYNIAVPKNWNQLMRDLGYGNNEVAVMKQVCDEYYNTTIPAYVIFVTDGGVGGAEQIKKVLRESSKKPIFWQFVGVGGSRYGVLEQFDTMGGRYVDNANFFALDDFKTVPDSELYSRLLNEFPQWLKEIKQKKMI